MRFILLVLCMLAFGEVLHGSIAQAEEAKSQDADLYKTSEKVGHLIAVASSLGGLVVFGMGLTQYKKAQEQYRNAQDWKRTEFAASLLRELNSDKDLIAACAILDYPARTLVLDHRPKEKEPGKPAGTNEDDACWTLEHDQRKLIDAMKLRDAHGPAFLPHQMVYRDIFDKFFTYVGQIHHFCDQKLIIANDVQPIAYWLRRVLSAPDRAKSELRLNDDVSALDVFGAFVIGYHPSVIKMALLYCDGKYFTQAGSKLLHEWKEQAEKMGWQPHGSDPRSIPPAST